MRCVLKPLAQGSNVQGASCTRVLCNVGTLHPRQYDPYSEIQSASTTSDILHVGGVLRRVAEAICKTYLMLQKQGMWCFVYSLENSTLCFMTQVKKHFEPQMYDILFCVIYACWVNDLLLWFWLLGKKLNICLPPNNFCVLLWTVWKLNNLWWIITTTSVSAPRKTTFLWKIQVSKCHLVLGTSSLYTIYSSELMAVSPKN
jgi:hypothetical protein